MSQRLRIVFAKGQAIKYISHLDLVRTWERAFRRAGLPLIYSQGYNPRPKIAFGAALPVGLTSSAEVLDVWLSPALAAESLAQVLGPQLPAGLKILQVSEVALSLPSLQSCMQWAEYRVTLPSELSKQELERRIASLLDAPSLMRQRLHKGKERAYDLRPLILDIWLDPNDSTQLYMRLSNSSEATGRPDEVLAELGLEEAITATERTRLVWKDEL